MQTYTLEQVAALGWMSPEEAEHLRAEVNDLIQRCEQMVTELNRHHETVDQQQASIEARVKSLEYEFNVLTGKWSHRQDSATH